MCMGATANKRSIWTGRKKKPLEEAKSLGIIGTGRNSKEVKKGYVGLAGRMIR